MAADSSFTPYTIRELGKWNHDSFIEFIRKSFTFCPMSGVKEVSFSAVKVLEIELNRVVN